MHGEEITSLFFTRSYPKHFIRSNATQAFLFLMRQTQDIEI